MSLMIKNISVVGLGKLGLCLAAVLAERGFNVIGIDVDNEKVNTVNAGHSPIYEPGLEDLIKKNRNTLKATTKYSEAINQTDATFIVVPTPSENDGSFSLKYVKQAIEEIGKELKNKKDYHLVVVTSTIGPGSMDNVIMPLLEKSSNKKCGDLLGLCYNPEFIALGEVIKGLLEPDFVLIGESDKKAGDLLEYIQRKVCLNNPPIERMEFINAEIAKIAINSFVTMKMSFANMLAEICERVPKGNVDKVSRALGRDKRIGPYYLKGALGYGGPCFPRDNIAFEHYARKFGAHADLALVTHKVNQYQVERITRLIERLAKDKRIGILGLSYKPNTNIIEESQSLQIAKNLADKGFVVNVYDPASMENAKALLSNKVNYCNSATECVQLSDLIVLATPWKEFLSIDFNLFKDKTVVDCWRFFPDQIKKIISKYYAIGIFIENEQD
jgi:UDPglucose 6-dehydrogenase